MIHLERISRIEMAISIADELKNQDEQLKKIRAKNVTDIVKYCIRNKLIES